MDEKITLDHRPDRVPKPKHSSPKFFNLVNIYRNTRIDKVQGVSEIEHIFVY